VSIQMSIEKNDSLEGHSTEGDEDNSQQTLPAIKHLRYTAATDIGMRREENQDSYGIIENNSFRVFIVADGMGGVQGGATASKMAVSIVEQYLKDKTELNAANICQAIAVANKLIFEKGADDPSLNGMGTTFVGIAFVEKRMFIINVGDSRAYCIRKNYVKRLTEDHTLVMELVRSGTISVEQASNHPVSHMLTRSLGPTPEIEIDCHLSDSCPMPDDHFLLCSDGLYNMVAESEMLDIISNNSIDQATELLIELANQRGGTDNITLILVKTDNDFPSDSKVADAAREEYLLMGPEVNIQEDGEEVIPVILEEGEEVRLDSYDPFALPEEKTEKKPKVESKKTAPEEEAPEPEQEIDQQEKASASVKEEEKVTGAETEFKQTGPGAAANAGPMAMQEEIEESNEPRRSTQSIVITGVMAGIIGGTLVVLLSKVLFLGPAQQNEPPTDSGQISKEEPQYNIPVPKMPNIAKNDSMIVPMRQDVQKSDNSTLSNPDSAAETTTSDNAIVNLEKRRDKLIVSIRDTNINIERFKNPDAAKVEESISIEEKKLNLLSENLKQVRNEIDNATRKIAIWYGRKTRIKESDLTNLASEVAVSSQEVKKKKEEFELASWNYLKEAETLRYMPSDADQRKKVDQLIEVRNKKIQEMSDAVNQAIDHEIKAVEKDITDFTIQREKLQDQLDYSERNLQYLKVLSSGNDELKNQKKLELENTLLSLESELGDLQKLLPEKLGMPAENNAEAVKDKPAAVN
jgi:serine/threonine protein phosphatase PrpC